MASQELRGFRVAVLATDGFEQSELMEPLKALDEAGADTEVISPQKDKVRGWQTKQWGEEVPVDRSLDDADPGEFDALVLPGGVINADALRTQPKALAFIKAFCDAGKPIGAICHAPWALIEVGAVRGHRMTSWPSLKTDLENGGAQWVDEQVVVDGELVTSRKPDDLPAFNRELTRLFAKAQHRILQRP
jgi:protease I